MRDRIERAVEAGNLIVRVQRIGIVGVAQAEGPGQRAGDLPGVLGVEVEIEKVEWLVGDVGKVLRRGRCHSVDELRQGRVGDRGNRALAEVVVIQAEDAGVGAEAELVRAVAPGEIVIDEEAGGAPALNPGVVESADGGEGRVGAAALQHDRKGGERLLKVGWGRTGSRTRRMPD